LIQKVAKSGHLAGTITSQPIEIIREIFMAVDCPPFFLKKDKKDSKLEWISVREKVTLRKAFI